MKKIVNILFLFFIGAMQAQQLNCTVQINSDKVPTTNNQIFKNLKNSISDFVNKTDWTGEDYKANEKDFDVRLDMLNRFLTLNFNKSTRKGCSMQPFLV